MVSWQAPGGRKEKRKKEKRNPGEIGRTAKRGGRDEHRGGYIQLQEVLARSWGEVCEEIDDNVTCLTQL